MFVLARQQSPRSQAVSQLRNAIVTGQLKPWSMHSEQPIAAGIAISRTAIRDALLHLAREGLVELVPHRGVRIAGATPSAHWPPSTSM